MQTPHDSSSGSIAEPPRASAPRPADANLSDLCTELEQRIAAGEPARAEEYFARHPELTADPEQALDLVFSEYAARREHGESPPTAEYFSRFPQWQTLLERQFQLEDLLDHPTLVENASVPGLPNEIPRPPTASVRGRFRIIRLLAQGGIGQVLRAVDTELNREVAIKELLPNLADSGKIRERFLREAEITGKLEHPGIVPVYGLGHDSAGRPYYAMRLMRGETLQDAVLHFHRDAEPNQKFSGVEFQKLLRRFLSVCETVAYAHSRGIIHRDLKPANILLGPFGETLVVDWGLARASGPAGPRPLSRDSRFAGGDSIRQSGPIAELVTPVAHWSNELTQVSGELIGTPAFMSPEQASGGAAGVGPASDVYSLGAALYVLLTGRAPFSGSQVGKTLTQVTAGEFPRPREVSRTIPRALEAIVLKAMALRPADRYESPRALASDLEHWLADEPISAAGEPLIARLARYARRHRAPVVAGSIALLVVTLVSLAAALRINSERLRADRERIEANRRNARLAFDRAQALSQEHEHGAAMLWFARALEHSPTGDAAMRRVLLTNIAAARHHLVMRDRVFSHPSLLTAWAFSPDGNRLITTDASGVIRVRDVAAGDDVARHSLLVARIVAVGSTSDGDFLVVGRKAGELLVQRLPASPAEEPDPPVVLAYSDELATAAISPDGSLLAAGSRANPASARFWSVSSGELIAQFQHPGEVHQIVFQPATNHAATVCSDGRVRLWNLSEKRLIREFRPASGALRRIAFTPDGKQLIIGDSAGCVSCWNAQDGQRLLDVVRHPGAVTAVVCADDGQTIAAAWDTGTTRAWNLETLRPVCEQLRLDRFTSRLAFRPGTRQLLIASDGTELVLWGLPDLVRVAPPLNQSPLESIAFSADGKRAITSSPSKTARLRDGATGRSYGKALKHKLAIRKVAMRPDGEVALTASRDGTVRLWKAKSGQPHAAPLEHGAVSVEAAAFSPDGSTIATADMAGVVRTWHCDTGELIGQLDDSTGSATSICFSHLGQSLAAGFGPPENGVRVWDKATGKLLWKGQHQEAVRSVAFSPDDRFVISGSNDNTAQIRDAKTGGLVGRELLHRGEVFAIGFSPDGKLAVTGGFDGNARLWAVPSGQSVGEPMRHEGVVRSAVFSADGLRLLTGSADGFARLWDVATCLPLSAPLPHRGQVVAVALNPAGDTALTGRFWRLPAPLPDDPPLIDLWVQLATERAFTAGENVEWLNSETVAGLARAFQVRAGQPWSDWATDASLSPPSK